MAIIPPVAPGQKAQDADDIAKGSVGVQNSALIWVIVGVIKFDQKISMHMCFKHLVSRLAKDYWPQVGNRLYQKDHCFNRLMTFRVYIYAYIYICVCACVCVIIEDYIYNNIYIYIR